jgi:hypothetical protein
MTHEERKSKRFTSERALLLVSAVVLLSMYFMVGFEITVITGLGFIAAHVMKISLRYPDN